MIGLASKSFNSFGFRAKKGGNYTTLLLSQHIFFADLDKAEEDVWTHWFFSDSPTSVFEEGNAVDSQSASVLKEASQTESTTLQDFNQSGLDIKMNFGGFGTAPTQPSPWINVWDNAYSGTDVVYPVIGALDVVAENNGSNWWGFTNQTAKSGDNALIGTNYYPNTVLGNWWFVQNRSANLRIRGLDPNKKYTIVTAGCRPGVATFRETRYTIGGTTIIKQSNRSGTDSVFTTLDECAVFNNISPDVNGHIVLNVEDNNQEYGYLNAIEIFEQISDSVSETTTTTDTSNGSKTTTASVTESATTTDSCAASLVIFEETSFASTSDFPITGTSITRGTGKLDMTGNPTLWGSHVVYDAASSPHRYTGLEKWKQRLRVKTPSSITSTSYGIGIGVDSINTFDPYSTSIRWSWDTGGPQALGSLYLYSKETTSGQIFSAGSYTPVANTYYWIEVERIKNQIKFTLFSDAGLQLFTETLSFNLSSGYNQAHNAGQFVIYHFGGNGIEVTDWVTTTEEITNPEYIVIGDSNTYGLFATSNAQRWAEIALSGKSYSVSAGIADRTAEVVSKLPEIIRFRPTKVLLSIGRNDVANGVALATTTANIDTIISTLEAEGIAVHLAGVIASNFNVSSVQNHYDTKPNVKVNLFQATKGGTTALNASYDSGDAIHLNVAGHAQVADVVGDIANAILGGISETATALDTTDASTQGVQVITESTTATDSTSATVTVVASISETTTSTDTVSGVKTTSDSISETGALADTTTGVYTALTAVSESSLWLDSGQATLTALAERLESTSATSSEDATVLSAAIETDFGALLLTGYSPNLVIVTQVNAATGELTLLGYAPTLSITQNAILNTGVGQALFTGYKPFTPNGKGNPGPFIEINNQTHPIEILV